MHHLLCSDSKQNICSKVNNFRFRKDTHLVFPTREQPSTIRAESQTGDSPTVAPQKIMRLTADVFSHFAQLPQSDGVGLYVNRWKIVVVLAVG